MPVSASLKYCVLWDVFLVLCGGFDYLTGAQAELPGL